MSRNCAALAALLLIAAVTTSCVPIPAAPSAPVSTAKNAEPLMTDPWEYCAAVITSDAPDARFGGPAMPEAVASGLQQAIMGQVATPTPAMFDNSFWRCMDGKVFGCTVGANLPCMDQAHTSTTPTDGMITFCKEQPNTDFIPMYITGHNTIYEWTCQGSAPQAGRQIAEVDAQGFIKGIWYEIPPMK